MADEAVADVVARVEDFDAGLDVFGLGTVRTRQTKTFHTSSGGASSSNENW